MFLYEKYGIAEFDNSLYTNTIDNAISKLNLNASGNIVVDFISNDIKFKKIFINLSGVLTWIDILNIYYCNDDEYYNLIEIMHGPAIVSNFRNDIKYYNCINRHIKIGSIFLALNANALTYNVKKGILKMIYHEIGHLYTNRFLNKKQLENNDLTSHFANNENEIVENLEASDINDNIDKEMLYNIFLYMMYYFNLSESHAHMENINFELEKSLSNFRGYKHNLKTILQVDDNEYNTFKYASSTLSIYMWLNELLDKMYELNVEIKQTFDKTYRNNIKDIYGKFISFNRLVTKYKNEVRHIILNAKKIYAYYYELYNCKAVNESKIGLDSVERYI